MGIHQNDVIFLTGSIRVNSENKLAIGIVDGEAIAGEEDRSLENCEVGFLFHGFWVLLKALNEISRDGKIYIQSGRSLKRALIFPCPSNLNSRVMSSG